MDQSSVKPREIYKRSMLNRSEHSKTSFSQIQLNKSINNNGRGIRKSLIQKYNIESEEIKINKIKIKFYIEYLSIFIVLLVVSIFIIF